jgi:hypothetical protein
MSEEKGRKNKANIPHNEQKKDKEKKQYQHRIELISEKIGQILFY